MPVRVLALASLLLTSVAALPAQRIPPPVAGAIQVTPDGDLLFVNTNTSGLQAAFIVKNASSSTGTWTLSCSVTGPVTCQGLDITQVTLAPNQTADVTATYSAGAAGSGSVRVTATGNTTDQGYYAVTVLGQGAPALSLRNHNRDNVDRGMCLTLGGAGEASGVECGQLFVVHGTPAYATMGKSRSLTLLYNSAQAMPGGLVAATLSEAGLAQPSAMYLELRVNGTLRDSATYQTSDWGGAFGLPVRQAALWFADTTLATGIYPFTVAAQNQYPGSSLTTTVADTIMMVNQAASDLGAGWNLAGIERLYFNQPVGTTRGDILWVGGDGSAKWYRRQAAPNDTIWVASKGVFQDSLIKHGTSNYTRTLRHGIQVVFDMAGQHLKTINRTQQYSRFHWTTGGKLDSIIVPPSPSNGSVLAGTAYLLAYDANGKLDRITDPAGRILDATITSNRLLSLADPDTTVATTFLYGQSGVFPTLLTRRTTRRGFAANFIYQASLVTQATFPHDTTASPVLETTGYTLWNAQGVAQHPHSSQQSAVDTAVAHTVVQGPRPGLADSAAFWVDRWGAPVKTKDALGNTTTLSRGNANTPALITRLVAADGKVDSLEYDARGNLKKDSTAYPDGTPPTVNRWTYLWPNTPDSPDSAIAPLGLKSRYTYNVWGLDSTARAPNGHVTRFEYVTSGTLSGLVKAVWDSLVPTLDSVAKTKVMTTRLHTGFAFDVLGNVVADTSAQGRVRSYTRDAAERVTDIYDPGLHRTSFDYDAANRTRRQRVYESAGVQDTTTWRWRLDVMDQVTDPRGVPRRFSYDPSGRVTAEIDDYGAVESRWFSLAGQLDSLRQRAGYTVRREYLGNGLQSKLAWPSRASTLSGLGNSPADSVIYSYDTMGRMIQAATTRDDTIKRTYYGTGLLKTEVAVRIATGAKWSVGYNYDAAGRRTSLRIGTPGDPTRQDSVWYRYDSTGVRSLTVRWRAPASDLDSVRFFWDGLGRRDSVWFANLTAGTGGGPLSIGYTYDADGLLRRLCSAGTEQTNGVFNLGRYVNKVDADGQVTKVNGTSAPGCYSTAPDSMDYDSRHQVIYSNLGTTGVNTYTYDASGNRRSFNGVPAGPTGTDSILAGHNRLLYHGNIPSFYTWFTYDQNGSRGKEIPCIPACDSVAAHGRSYGMVAYIYDGLGRSVGRYTWLPVGTEDIWTGAGCSYDALGRQRQTCEAGQAVSLGYDGNNVVRTSNDADQYGWTFIHGPGTDDPLLARRQGNEYFLYVTDGQGCQYSVGTRFGDRPPNGIPGQNAAGATGNSNGFGASRLPSADMPSISFFRNRWYDQGSGRWTQEDPIGIAGGLNLYQFNGNNPSAYTDPFGLCVEDACVIEGGATVAAVGWGLIATGIAITHGKDLSGALQEGYNAGRDAVTGIFAAVSGKILDVRLTGQANNIADHFTKLGNPNQPGGEDPDTRNKWKKDIQKGIREMKKLADRLKGKAAERWQDRIKGIEDQLSKTQ